MQNGSASGSIFLGRRETCALLEKRLDAFRTGYRQNVAVIGPASIGKSYLVRHFLVQTPRSDVIFVVIPCQEFDAFERFCQHWMTELLLGFHKAVQSPPPTNAHELISSLRGVIPKTLQRMRGVKKLLLKRSYDQAYQEVVSLSSTLHEEGGRKMLIVLDEFDRLAELGLPDPFAALGKEIMVQKDTMFFVTSSFPQRSRSIFRDKLALLFGNFEVIELNPFDFDESREFIAQRLPLRPLETEFERYLIRMTDGHPFYLDVLLARLRQLAVSGESIHRDLIIETLTQELYHERGTMHQYFRSRLYQAAQARPWPFFGDVLAAIALGNRKLSQMTRFLRLKGSEIKRILDRLLASEAIVKCGALFHIPDSLFRFWLGKIYYRQRFLSGQTADLTELSFREDVLRSLEKSKLGDQKELPKRIEELFIQFRNESLELSRRKFTCPYFTEVLSRPNNGRAFPVLARNAKTRWLCQVVSGLVTEDDVRLFLQDLKRYRDPIHQKWIIGLRGIDLNAKLLAQETKIQYLDLRTLNSLLDLYDQPKLVF